MGRSEKRPMLPGGDARRAGATLSSQGRRPGVCHNRTPRSQHRLSYRAPRCHQGPWERPPRETTHPVTFQPSPPP